MAVYATQPMTTHERELVRLQLKLVRVQRNAALRRNDLGLAEAALREEQALATRLRALDERIAERRAELEAATTEPTAA